MEPFRLTASQAAAAMRDGRLTVEAYATSLLGRIAARDADVRAWAYLDPKQVLEEARRLDLVPADRRGPLHGVAVGIKDVFYTKDMPTQFNSPIYDGHAPATDAACIAILRAAGALLLGKTTTTEFAATVVGTRTTNPHDMRRTPGGSSAGSAAAVADLQVPLALGTQTGGSTIRPGSFNGIYALKPTWNVVSREGAKFAALLYDTVGFYARSVDDLEMVADVFAVHDDAPTPASLPPSPPSPPAAFALRGARFAVVKTVVWPQAGPGTAAALAAGAALLRQHGAVVDEVELPPELDALPLWQQTWLAAEYRTTFLSEYRAAKDELAPSLTAYVAAKPSISNAAQTEAFDRMAAARPVVDTLAAQYAALITPSVVDEAPLGLAQTGSAAFNSIWTAMHVPVVNVPGLAGPNGMPVGLSLVAPRHRDRHLLGVARAVGAVFTAEGGWSSAL